MAGTSQVGLHPPLQTEEGGEGGDNGPTRHYCIQSGHHLSFSLHSPSLFFSLNKLNVIINFWCFPDIWPLLCHNSNLSDHL